MEILIQYLFLVSICLLFSFVEINVQINRSQLYSIHLLYWIGAVIVFFFSLGLYKHSGDYVPYYNVINNLDLGFSLSNQKMLFNYEKGFMILSLFVRNIITKNTDDIILIIMSLPLIFYFFSFFKWSKLPICSLAIFVAHFHWWLGVVLLRQMFAVCFMTLAVHYLLTQNNNMKYFLFCFIAVMFHSSAILFFVFPFILKLKIKESLLIIIIIISFVIGETGGLVYLFDSLFVTMERGEIYSNYLDGSRGMNVVAYLEMFLVFLAIRSCAKGLSQNLYHKYLYLSAFSLILCGILIKVEVGSRIAMYFNYLIYIYIVPHLLTLVRNRKSLIIWSILSIYLLAFTYRFVLITIVPIF